MDQVVKTPGGLSLEEAGREAWDVVVIGAGPAGALAARQCARAALRTLLIDARRFPRRKACGGCLSHRAIGYLRACGLEHTLADVQGLPLQSARFVAGRRSLVVDLPPGMSICRARFDHALVRAAIAAGARLLQETTASVAPVGDASRRDVLAQCGGRTVPLGARVVICADGLLRTSVKALPRFASIVAPSSRVGVATTLADTSDTYPPGDVLMAVGPQGYVGMARIDDGRLNIAAALDRAHLKDGVPLSRTVQSVLNSARLPIPCNLASAPWLGTPPLTSRPGCVAAERLFLIGDAGGYVEPFTGEGMAWAFESALHVAPLVVEASRQWHPRVAVQWQTTHAQLARRNQWACRCLASVLRRSWTVAAAMAFCRNCPAAARWLISRIDDVNKAQLSLAVKQL